MTPRKGAVRLLFLLLGRDPREVGCNPFGNPLLSYTAEFNQAQQAWINRNYEPEPELVH